MTDAMKDSMLVMLNTIQQQLDSMREMLLNNPCDAPTAVPLAVPPAAVSSSAAVPSSVPAVFFVAAPSVPSAAPPSEAPLVSSSSVQVTQFKCSRCPKVYLSKKPFQKHVDNNCGKIFACRICKGYYSNKKCYEKHEEICRQVQQQQSSSLPMVAVSTNEVEENSVVNVNCI